MLTVLRQHDNAILDYEYVINRKDVDVALVDTALIVIGFSLPFIFSLSLSLYLLFFTLSPLFLYYLLPLIIQQQGVCEILLHLGKYEEALDRVSKIATASRQQECRESIALYLKEKENSNNGGGDGGSNIN